MAPQQSWKHAHPRIILIDVGENAKGRLVSRGYRVESGTFGSAYKVQPVARYLALEFDHSLPDVAEQEIVIIDVAGPPPKERTKAYDPGAGYAFWVKPLLGILDPRPFVMARNALTFHRIHEHGGVFVVFAAGKETAQATFGHVEFGGLSRDHRADRYSGPQISDHAIS